MPEKAEPPPEMNKDFIRRLLPDISDADAQEINTLCTLSREDDKAGLRKQLEGMKPDKRKSLLKTTGLLLNKMDKTREPEQKSVVPTLSRLQTTGSLLLLRNEILLGDVEPPPLEMNKDLIKRLVPEMSPTDAQDINDLCALSAKDNKPGLRKKLESMKPERRQEIFKAMHLLNEKMDQMSVAEKQNLGFAKIRNMLLLISNDILLWDKL